MKKYIPEKNRTRGKKAPETNSVTAVMACSFPTESYKIYESWRAFRK